MSAPLKRFLLALATVLSVILVVSGAPKRPSDGKRAQNELDKLFDFEHYKKTFGKSYSSPAENSTRRCYFYARAMAAFVSGVNFKYRAADYYSALNAMSDWSPEERAKIRNRRRHGMVTRSMARKERPLPFMPKRGEDPEQTLLKFLEARSDDPKYRNLLSELTKSPSGGPLKSRARRDVARGPRDFSFDRLLHSKAKAKTGAPKPSALVPSNNPNYQGIELATRGLSDQLQKVDFMVLEPTGEDSESLEDQLDEALELADEDEAATDDLLSDELEDEMFVDHRDKGCMSEVRNQGQCGSCYAFASIAVVEWLYCKKNHHLVSFSEQYMIDCGQGRLEGMDGCEGATDTSVVEFIHNFGLELSRNYPYMEREETCPYDDETDLSTTGYIRMELGAFMEVPVKLWPMMLEEMPLYIIIEMDDNFLDYGGGVYDGSKCKQYDEEADEDTPRDYHAMVLVGHGREDGQEFWLIRNSHGADWGEQGYYKLAKSAPAGCIPEQVAYAFGTEKVRPRINRHWSESLLAGVKARKPSED